MEAGKLAPDRILPQHGQGPEFSPQRHTLRWRSALCSPRREDFAHVKHRVKEKKRSGSRSELIAESVAAAHPPRMFSSGWK